MIALAQPAPTRPGRRDQQSLADGAHEAHSGPEEHAPPRRPRIPRPYAAAQLRALEHDEPPAARAENTQAATRAERCCRAGPRATTAPIHGKRR